MGRLTGKTALVTGAARGIGAGIADEFERQGATVLRADVAADVGVTELHRLDVRDEAGWAALVASAAEEHGGIDVLVNNAGVGGGALLDALSEQEWTRTISINQTGTFLGTKHVLPGMVRRRSGSVINISSIFGARGVRGGVAYQASKAAVLGITRNTAVTYADAGVRANAIVPGWIRTPLTESQDPEVNDTFLRDTPLGGGKGGTPQDIAWAAVYLASDESAFVTGIELPVDGGYLAR